MATKKIKNAPEAAQNAQNTEGVLTIEKTPKFSPDNNIIIKGARGNNLRNVDLTIPKNKLVVVTGVSGSGKSSITMDTLFAEGQRRYVESLSSYARQFLMRMKKPDADYIKGICPAIAIEQKTTTGNNRSTVGSMTEVFEFLRLLYARIGHTISPVSGALVKKHQVSDVIDFILNKNDGDRVQLFIPMPTKYADRTLETELNLLLQKGYTRIWHEGNLFQIDEILRGGDAKFQMSNDRLKEPVTAFRDADLRILIDRFVVKKEDEENTKRMSDSVQTAFYESEGEAIVEILGGETRGFNNRFELDGIVFIEPTPQLFNYNNSFGACPTCEGYGKTMGIDAEKIIPDTSKSVFEGAVACWKGEKSGEWLDAFLSAAHKFDFPVHRPYKDLSKAEIRILWQGNAYFNGINKFFQLLEEQTYKIQNRVMLARYRGRTTCPSCAGKRLRQEALYVKMGGHDIADLIEMPIDELQDFFNQLELTENDRQIGRRLLLEVNNRLGFMMNVGLGYLTLSRVSSTLSGGETQRINLTRTLGSNLTSSMYILDEPSVGLHPRDTARLVTVLKNLRDMGNTVVVVEHEEEIIKNADFLVDMGPEAGINGGHVVFAGNYEDIYTDASDSLTTKYMNGSMQIETPSVRRRAVHWLELKGARQHNLKNVSVKIPLNTLTVVSGVSGSGKTTLVKQILFPALQRELDSSVAVSLGQFDGLIGDIKKLTAVEMISQSPIGKSSRSNPVTYVKAYDDIRDLFSKQQLAKIRGYKAGQFSFNTDGGRCDTCKGEGEIVVEMQFLADVHLECEECRGRRFKGETLDVLYKGKSIYDVLQMSIDESIEFFKDEKNILQKIRPLSNVGLGYVQLGQSSSTLSGGEAQRVKLASFLTKENNKDHVFFIFDEPTTGLHFHDIRKLLTALNALVEKGHTVLVVEHNMEVIKSADWVIDLGAEGGKLGGKLVYQGTPEGLADVEESFTGQFLKEKFV
ncbi:MAG: excinuclease ABC subunit UvrA [Saprospiraceae bacterium]|nr:excinuclease ABC subunit UvrA [Saprospiraceae bacterium]